MRVWGLYHIILLLKKSKGQQLEKKHNTRWDVASEEQQALKQGLLFAQTQVFLLIDYSINYRVQFSLQNPYLNWKENNTEAGSCTLKIKYFLCILF